MFHFVFDFFYFFFFFFLLLCFHRLVYHNKKINRLSSIYYLHVFVFLIFASTFNDSSSTPCARNAVLYAVYWCKPVVFVWMLIDFRWMMVQNSVSVWCFYVVYVCIIYNRISRTVNNSLCFFNSYSSSSIVYRFCWPNYRFLVSVVGTKTIVVVVVVVLWLYSMLQCTQDGEVTPCDCVVVWTLCNFDVSFDWGIGRPIVVFCVWFKWDPA